EPTTADAFGSELVAHNRSAARHGPVGLNAIHAIGSMGAGHDRHGASLLQIEAPAGELPAECSEHAAIARLRINLRGERERASKSRSKLGRDAHVLAPVDVRGTRFRPEC